MIDLFAVVYWGGIVAVVVWWVWSMRQAARPRTRTPLEDAELSSLLAAIERLQATPAPAPER